MSLGILRQLSGTHVLLITLAVMTGIGLLVERETVFRTAVEHYIEVSLFFLALAVSLVVDVLKQRRETQGRLEHIESHLQKLLTSSERLTTTLQQEASSITAKVDRALTGENLENRLARLRRQVKNRVLAEFWDLFSEKLLQLLAGNLVVATGDGHGPDNLYVNHMVLSLIMRETDEEFQGFTSIISEWSAAFSHVYYRANLERLRRGVKIERYFLVKDTGWNERHEAYCENLATEMERQHRDGISVRYLFESDAQSRLIVDEPGQTINLLQYPEYGLFRCKDGSEILMYRSGFDSYSFRTQLTTNQDVIRRMNIFAKLQNEAGDLVHPFNDREAFLAAARSKRTAEARG
jgi:hypothetical protein